MRKCLQRNIYLIYIYINKLDIFLKKYKKLNKNNLKELIIIIIIII